MVQMIAVGFFVFVLVLIWHMWRVDCLEAYFLKLHNESESYWNGQRSKLLSEIRSRKHIIKVLENENNYKAETITFASEALRGNYPGSRLLMQDPAQEQDPEQELDPLTKNFCNRSETLDAL